MDGVSSGMDADSGLPDLRNSGLAGSSDNDSSSSSFWCLLGRAKDDPLVVLASDPNSCNSSSCPGIFLSCLFDTSVSRDLMREAKVTFSGSSLPPSSLRALAWLSPESELMRLVVRRALLHKQICTRRGWSLIQIFLGRSNHSSVGQYQLRESWVRLR